MKIAVLTKALLLLTLLSLSTISSCAQYQQQYDDDSTTDSYFQQEQQQQEDEAPALIEAVSMTRVSGDDNSNDDVDPALASKLASLEDQVANDPHSADLVRFSEASPASQSQGVAQTTTPITSSSAAGVSDTSSDILPAVKTLDVAGDAPNPGPAPAASGARASAAIPFQLPPLPSAPASPIDKQHLPAYYKCLAAGGKPNTCVIHFPANSIQWRAINLPATTSSSSGSSGSSSVSSSGSNTASSGASADASAGSFTLSSSGGSVVLPVAQQHVTIIGEPEDLERQRALAQAQLQSQSASYSSSEDSASKVDLSSNPTIAKAQKEYVERMKNLKLERKWLDDVKEILSGYQKKADQVKYSTLKKSNNLESLRRRILRMIKEDKEDKLRKELSGAIQSLKQLESTSSTINSKISEISQAKQSLQGTIHKIESTLGRSGSAPSTAPTIVSSVSTSSSAPVVSGVSKSANELQRFVERRERQESVLPSDEVKDVFSKLVNYINHANQPKTAHGLPKFGTVDFEDSFSKLVTEADRDIDQ